MPALTCPLLREAEAGFAAATERFEALVAPLDEQNANWTPDPRRWSVASCVDHLSTAARTYFVHMIPALERARAAGGPTGGQPPYGRGTWVGRMLEGSLDPARTKFRALPAPGVFKPKNGVLDFAKVCDEFRQVQGEWATVLGLADGLDLGRIKFPTPVSRWLPVTAAQAVRIHMYHEPRHLAQAERVIQHPEFPA